MYIEGNYKKIKSNIDITTLRDAVLRVTPEEWSENQFRQKRFSVSQQVETILFKMNGVDLEGIGDDPAKTFIFEKSWTKWKHLVQPIIDEVIKYYPGYEKGFVNKAMLPNMRPGTDIPKHFDTMKSFSKSHRIHVPILTNDEVYFTVGGERVILEAGEAYEINNLKEHGVKNKGKTDRVHLLFDLYIPADNK